MKTRHVILLVAVAGLLWVAVRTLKGIQTSVESVGRRVDGVDGRLSQMQRQLEQPKETKEPRKES